jgi:hypothetical protein
MKSYIKYGMSLLALSLILFVSMYDFTSYPNYLNPIFEKAGSNQSELKKVIRHYSHHASDSLKLRAAVFLMENMDVHYSYQSDHWEKFQIELGILFKKEHEESKLTQGFDSISKKYELTDVVYLSDLKTIKARFLIRSIDYAFEKWKTPYAKHLTFDEFCEYLLPYRAGNEPLENWQTLFNEHYIPEVFSLTKKPIDSITAEDICKALRILKDCYLHTPPQNVPDFNVHLLLVAKATACRQYCSKMSLAARCIGVPVVLDYTPQWATRSMGHEWNSLITKNGKPLNFGINDECDLGKHIEKVPDRIPPKVYRRTFARQRESLSMIHGIEEIPPTLASPCMKDVTKDYYSTVDVPVILSFNPFVHHQFAYLAVFNNQDWIPVCWAKTANRKAVFKNLHKGILCLPGYYCDQNFIPAAHPIIIDSLGKISKIIPNLNQKQTLVLNRKYQTSLLNEYCKEMVGGKFQVSNDPNFAHAVDLYTIKKEPEASYQIVNTKQSKSYKYFRYTAPRKSRCNVAEIELYEAKSNSKLEGKITGGYLTKSDLEMIDDDRLSKVPFYIRRASHKNANYQIATFSALNALKILKFFILKQDVDKLSPNNAYQSELKRKRLTKITSNHPALPDSCPDNVFDGDVLTHYCWSNKEYVWVGMEFNSPKRIDKIVYLPRNDDNCIRDGELYELFYWNNRWVSLGQQTGSSKTYKLTYKNVPTHALFLLRNLTKGTEERIFTYEKGKQVWW